jgi:hypothetical protein
VTLLITHKGFEIRILEGPYLKDGAPTPEALEFCGKLTTSMDDLREIAAARFLKLYNETWLDDDIGLVTREQFIARLTNPRVVLLDEPGAANVYFDDGGLFAGHGIQVSVYQGIPADVNLVG